MEPVAATSAIRPVGAVASGDARPLLQDGRILAAQVLDRPDEGRLMLALGRHHVPADTNLRLEEGDSFLVRVVGSGDQAVLQILQEGDPIVQRLLDALRQVVGEGRPVGELLGELAATIRAELARPGGALEDLRALLADLSGQLVTPEGEESNLFELFRRSALRYEALLARFAHRAPTAAELEFLRGNLKARLLEALGRLEEGPVRKSLEHVLSSLESEQLLNVARRAAGDALVFSFPFPDPAGWTTAQLFLPPRERDAEGGERQESRDHPECLTVAVRFSRLGPVRADLVLTPARLDLRLFVRDEELAARLRADAEELARRVGDGKRDVHVFARAAVEAELDPAAHPLDIRFLRGRHILDLDG